MRIRLPEEDMGRMRAAACDIEWKSCDGVSFPTRGIVHAIIFSILSFMKSEYMHGQKPDKWFPDMGVRHVSTP